MHHKIIAEDVSQIAQNLSQDAHKLEGKTVLITGGGGFLGRYFVFTIDHLNRTVLKNPCKMIIIENFMTSLKHTAFDKIENLKLITHDVRIPLAIPEPVDYILHAAGIASPLYYVKYPLETIEVGTLGTKNMLELAKEKNSKGFLYFSSSEVYGDPDPKVVPIDESYRGNVATMGPRACYDESKRLGETLCHTYHQLFGTPVKIVRPFNVFGPGLRLDDFRVIPNFTAKAFRGEALPVNGDGSQTRTFCYVTDAITMFMKVLLSDHKNEAFNIGNENEELSMMQLAKIISELFDNKVPIKQIPEPMEVYAGADPKRRRPSMAKMRKLIGFDAQVNLRTGLQRFIEWAKDQDIPKVQT